MWSKVKSILRKIEARTNEALLLAIGEALSKVTERTQAIGWPIPDMVLFKML